MRVLFEVKELASFGLYWYFQNICQFTGKFPYIEDIKSRFNLSDEQLQHALDDLKQCGYVPQLTNKDR